MMTPFIREESNPLITPEMVKPSRGDFEVVCAFNAGVAEYEGEILLLLRVAEKPYEGRLYHGTGTEADGKQQMGSWY